MHSESDGLTFMDNGMKLFLCEKPSQGRDIAAVLGATEKKSGYLSGAGGDGDLGVWASVGASQP